MRLCMFLNEKSTYVTELTMDRALEVLTTKCKKNWEYTLKQRNPVIYRGDFALEESAYIFNSNTIRKSAYTTNYYTLLFSDILDSWNNFPKRNRSIICTTDESYAASYGTTYIVIPFDNTKIASAGTPDIWKMPDNDTRIFKWLPFKVDLPYLNNVLFSDIGIKETQIKQFLNTKFSSLYKKYASTNIITCYWYAYLICEKLGILNSIISNIHNNNYGDIDKFIQIKYEKIANVKLYDALNYTLSPKILGASIINYSDIRSNDKLELWMDSNAVLLEYYDWIDKIDTASI